MSLEMYINVLHAKRSEISAQRGFILPLRECHRTEQKEQVVYVPPIVFNNNVKLVTKMHDSVQNEFLPLYDLQRYRKENLELKLMPKVVSALGKLVTYKGEVTDALYAIESLQCSG